MRASVAIALQLLLLTAAALAQEDGAFNWLGVGDSGALTAFTVAKSDLQTKYPSVDDLELKEAALQITQTFNYKLLVTGTQPDGSTDEWEILVAAPPGKTGGLPTIESIKEVKPGTSLGIPAPASIPIGMEPSSSLSPDADDQTEGGNGVDEQEMPMAMPGGFGPEYSADEMNDPEVQEAFEAAEEQLQSKFTDPVTATLISVQSQVVAGINYRLLMEVEVDTLEPTQWEAVVYRPLGPDPVLEVTSLEPVGPAPLVDGPGSEAVPGPAVAVAVTPTAGGMLPTNITSPIPAPGQTEKPSSGGLGCDQTCSAVVLSVVLGFVVLVGGV